jgi:hypothetical protein
VLIDAIGAFRRVTQLPGAEALRMTRQDLLDQGGAGTRHANDENRHVGRVAETGLLRDEIARERRASPLQQLDLAGLVIRDLSPLERGAPDQMLERGFVPAGIDVRLAETVVQTDLLVDRERGQILRQLLHRREMRAIWREPSILAEAIEKRRYHGREVHRLLERRLRLGRSAELRQHPAALRVRDREVRIELDGPLVLGQRLLEAAVATQRLAKLDVREGIVRLERERRADMRQRRLQPIEVAYTRPSRMWPSRCCGLIAMAF